VSMSHPRARLRAGVIAAVAATTALAAAAPALATAEKVGPPNVMTALGDSITRGFHTGALLQDVPANSWATGTNTTVNSVCLRIKAINSVINCGAANGANGGNDAVTGAKVAGTLAQAQNAVGRSPKPELVTILIGANDVCTSSESTMTSTDAFESSFRATMSYLSANLPDARIEVSSIPNIYNLWNVGRQSAAARTAWSIFSVCRSMLASPTDLSTAAEARRQRVKAREEAFNAILETVCEERIHCRWDGGAAYGLQFALSDLSTIDYFHPNISGQAKAAALAWSAGFDYADATAPTTTITRDRPADGVEDWYRDDVTVTLSSDAADLDGSEYYYTLVGTADQPWTKYTGPFTISSQGETQVVARSVDINGNVEASRSDVIKIDKTAPAFTFTCMSPVTLNGAATQTIADAADDRSGFAEDPDGTATIDTSVLGTNSSTAEIQDRAGNVAAHACSYAVRYAYSGLLQPINADGSSLFRLGSTVPVKFRLADAGGVLQTSAVARLEVAKVSDDVEGSVLEATSTSNATTGNLFRYDADSDTYIFNLSTKGLSAGTWSVRVVLDDGTTQSTRISLR
jgi:lysophospholipase L1-like esterase